MVFFKLTKLEKANPDGKGNDKAVDAKGSTVADKVAAGIETKPNNGGGPQEKEKKKKTKTDDAGGSATAGGSSGSTSQKPTSTSGPSVNDFISKTKTQQRKGLKPSGPELIAYARYLGIDPVVDHDLLWIAVEALEAPLPSEWTEHFDSNDRVFYYNATTRISSWTHPLEHEYRETYETIVNFRNSNLSTAERQEQLHRLQLETDQMERDVHQEIGLWTEHTDEHGHRFYYNAQARHSSWTDPRPAKCHILYFRMKMLRVLESCMRNPGAGHVAREEARERPAQPQAAAREVKEQHPRFSHHSPRRDREGAQPGAVNAEPGPTAGAAIGDSKRPKVAGGSDDGIQRGERICGDGGGHSEHAWAGGGSGELLSPGRSEDVHGSPREHEGIGEERKHKKKKKKKREDAGPNDSAPQRTLQNSQSEPSVGGSGKGSAPPPMNGEEARTSFSGPHSSAPSSYGFDSASESLSTAGRVRVKAGIRLQPIGGGGLQPLGGIGGAPLSGDGGAASNGMQGSLSVPELKPLDKLHPL